MIEQLAMSIGRHVHVRGVGRFVGALYPCRADSARFVRGVRTRSDGLRVDVDTRQLIDWSMLFRGTWEPHLGKLFGTLVHNGGTTVDVGANVGAHTLTLARLVGRAGRVIAFEPNPPIRDRLDRNVQLNGFGNVVVYPCALGDADGHLALRVPKAGSDEYSNPGLASLVALDTPHDLVDVPVRCFDEICKAEAIRSLDVIKIDVQGFEVHVLRGMAETLQQLKPAIVFEYEDWAWGKAGNTFNEACQLLRACGYALWRIDPAAGLRRLSAAGAAPVPAHMELLAMPKDDPRLAAVDGRTAHGGTRGDPHG